MSDAVVVVILGGTPTQRAAATADLLSDGRTALVLTGHPGAVDPRLDTGDDGAVEVRADDPATRLESYRSGAVDPDDDVLAALSAGGDTPLASVLGWEYARRAAASGYWDVVVVELDGDISGVRRIAAAGELATFVESRWPAHVRFASMAAGDRAQTRVQEAHRLAALTGDVSDFLAGPIDVRVVGDDTGTTATLATLARGAVRPTITTFDNGYLVEIPVPVQPSAPVAVDGDRIRLDLEGFRVALSLPALLARCELVGTDFDAAHRQVVAHFLPDPDLWPENLVPSASGGQAR